MFGWDALIEAVVIAMAIKLVDRLIDEVWG
jgi:hypothetical protein